MYYKIRKGFKHLKSKLTLISKKKTLKAKSKYTLRYFHQWIHCNK